MFPSTRIKHALIWKHHLSILSTLHGRSGRRSNAVESSNQLIEFILVFLSVVIVKVHRTEVIALPLAIILTAVISAPENTYCYCYFCYYVFETNRTTTTHSFLHASWSAAGTLLPFNFFTLAVTIGRSYFSASVWQTSLHFAVADTPWQ